jgi:hypothetical protein
MSSEKKVRVFADYFVLSCGKSAGFAGPFGINQVIHDLR